MRMLQPASCSPSDPHTELSGALKPYVVYIGPSIVQYPADLLKKKIQNFEFLSESHPVAM